MRIESKTKTLGIIPAAGSASRFAGAPKFFLPSPKISHFDSRGGEVASSLLLSHVRFQLEFAREIVVVTRPEWVSPMSMQLSDLGGQVRVISMETHSVCESTLVATAVGSVHFSPETFILSLPDTFFSFEMVVRQFSSLVQPDVDLGLLCWKNNPSSAGRFGEVLIEADSSISSHVDKPAQLTFPHHWGVMSFNSNFLELIDFRDTSFAPSIDMAIARGLNVQGSEAPGSYFDAGTLMGYRDLLVSQASTQGM